jgi:hypothetical protein
MNALGGRTWAASPRTNSTSVRLSTFDLSVAIFPAGYEVIKQLLHNGREFEYRIKSANEEHEPVAGEREKAS